MFYLFFEGLQVMLDNVPDNGRINLVISVYEMMTHISNVLPRNFWMGRYEGTTKLIGCFTNYHCIIHYTAKKYFVGNEGVVGQAFCTLQNDIDGFKNVAKPFLVSQRFSHK